jgi:hypothetical protein
MSNVTYRSNDNQAGAIPVDTVIETELQGDNSQRQVVKAYTTSEDELTDYFGEVAYGNITGRTVVNKFGIAPSGIQTSITDVWSRADAAATQPVWLAPTAARVHAIVSSSAADTGFNVRVYGLTSWDTAETSELVALNGTTPVNTVNSYVIIHRMKCIYTAAKTTNAGVISATAADDATITAVIAVGDGQTEMAIYGVPSIQKALLWRWGCSIDGASAAAATVDFQLRVNENPNVQTTGFLRKEDMGLQSTGANSFDRYWKIPPVFAGPCIIKVSGIGSANDIDAKSGFDLELVTI